MKILTFNDKAEWLEWRRTGIGSSDIAALMGVDPWKSPLDIYDSKDCLAEDGIPNSRMQRGIDNEGEARSLFNAIMENTYIPLNCEHPDIPIIHASLDGYWNKKILEIKVPGRKVMEMAREGVIPIYYVYQIQWQFLATFADMAYYLD